MATANANGSAQAQAQAQAQATARALALPLLHCSVWGAAYPHAAAACQRHVDARRIKLDFYCHRYYID